MSSEEEWIPSDLIFGGISYKNDGAIKLDGEWYTKYKHKNEDIEIIVRRLHERDYEKVRGT